RWSWDAVMGAVVLAVAYALKRHYSLASASELAWVLGPTAAVAAALTGSPFLAERGVGYVSTELHTAIVPACAGVNFLIVALCTLGFGFVGSFRTVRTKALWLPATLVLAYVATVVVNGTRVALGIAVRRSEFLGAWLSPAEAHRVLGIAVYLVALWGLFATLGPLIERHARERTS
ncbi:MAG TPA: exosortase K, partial [Polyangiaceae bacterium]